MRKKDSLLESFAGMRNDVPLESFSTKDLSASNNVYLDDDGGIHNRQGVVTTRLGNIHSVYDTGSFTLFVEDDDLCRYVAGGDSIILEVGVAARVSYAQANGLVYWSDGVKSGVTDGVTAWVWGVTPPSGLAPQNAPGNLRHGAYLVTAVAVRADGVESAPSEYEAVNVTSGGISLTIPAVDAEYVDVYISDAGGSVPFFSGRYASGAGSDVVSTPVQTARGVKNLSCGPAPTGSRVFFFAGRMWVVKDKFLMFSLPYEFELFDVATGFIPAPSRIRMAVPVDDGIYMATSTRTYFLSGTDPYAMRAVEVANVGAVSWSDSKLDNTKVGKDGVPGTAVAWLSSKGGICVGNNGGNMKDVTGPRFAGKTGRIGVSSVVDTPYSTQYIVSTFT